ncbi:hypothetical protein V8J88_13760 [Massilia sp. W12]|uniref:hypothetical protein n=1 Tax=Massilia sp. W12 TaxID=3126507 RepID=UPI0030D190C2
MKLSLLQWVVLQRVKKTMRGGAVVQQQNKAKQQVLHANYILRNSRSCSEIIIGRKNSSCIHLGFCIFTENLESNIFFQNANDNAVKIKLRNHEIKKYQRLLVCLRLMLFEPMIFFEEIKGKIGK